MGEKERAEALLQAAGVTGVAVQSAEEMVTMSRVEADALRAGAAPSGVAETLGQRYERERNAQNAQPENELTVDAWEALPPAERQARMDELDAALGREAGPDGRPNYGHWKAVR
jgi:hypothetical protein